MARLFRPERIEYDILTAHPGSGCAPYWATAPTRVNASG